MSSKYTALINRLWPGDSHKQSRIIAHQWVAAFQDRPMMADRIEPLLREAARGDAMVRDGMKTQEDAQAYLLSFATEGLGTPGHLVEAMANWIPDLDAVPPATPEQPNQVTEKPAITQAQPTATQPPAAAPARPAGPTRAQLQERIKAHEADMRSPEGSEGWTRYWRGGGSQDYLATLQSLETGDEAPAGSAAVHAPATEPAAPGA
jgi:hypothetical protein